MAAPTMENPSVPRGNRLLCRPGILPVLLMPALLAAPLSPAATNVSSSFSPPLVFEPALQRTDVGAAFTARGAGYLLKIEPAAAKLHLKKTQAAPLALTFRWQGASPKAALSGETRAPGYSHYFTGSDPKYWRYGVPHFKQVRAAEIYPGIDLIYYGNGRQLEYDFVVQPGAEPSLIRLRVEGASSLALTPEGDLRLDTPGGAILQKAPVSYQEYGGKRVTVASRYRLEDFGEIRLEVGAYDRNHPLVIDPLLVWATYYGGAGMDSAYAVAVDAQRNVYIAGSTESVTLPVSGGGETPAPAGVLPRDGFVMKLSPDGSRILFATYLGGDRGDEVLAMTVDSAGNIYVGGRTDSTTFPVSQNARQRANGSAATLTGDGFVAKLDSSGSLIYSTYLGGSQRDQVLGITVDAAGSAYVTGETRSRNFPTTFGTLRATACPGENTDAFVTKVNADGSNWVYSTYVCGGLADRGLAIAVDQDGNAYVGGETVSPDFPVSVGAFRGVRSSEYQEGFVFKLNPTGSQLLYSTYLGGGFADSVRTIAVDALGFAVLGGSTHSLDFPVTTGAYQPTNRDGGVYEEGFVAKLSPDGRNLAFATYLGGSLQDRVTALVLDRNGNIYVTGFTASPDFPQSVSPCQPGRAGKLDAFAGRLAAHGMSLDWMVVLGGKEDDLSHALALDAEQNVYLAGSTASPNLPSTPGAYRTAYGQGYAGGGDAFVAKVAGTQAQTAPCIAAGGIVNGASFLAGPLAPGEIISIFGEGIGPGNLVGAVVENGRLTKSLEGVRVLFDGVPGAMIFTWSNQLSTIVPYAVAGRSETRVQVEVGGRRTAEVTVPVAPATPGIFSLNSSGEGPGAILNQDGSVNTPANRAAPESIIVIYATGAGQTTPAGEDGKIAPAALPLPKPVLPVKVFIGGQEAEVLYAGDAPFLVSGALQVNARIPAGTPAGALIPVVIQVGEARSQRALTVAVR